MPQSSQAPTTLSFSKVLSSLEVIGLLSIFLLPAYYYGSLPDLVPSHYGFNGLPDAYAKKRMIWFLPAMTIVTYISLLIGIYILKIQLNNKNFPQEIKAQLDASVDMMKSLRLFIIFLFLYLTYSNIQVALGNAVGLGAWFTVVVVVGILGILGYFLIVRIITQKPS